MTPGAIRRISPWQISGHFEDSPDYLRSTHNNPPFPLNQRQLWTLITQAKSFLLSNALVLEKFIAFTKVFHIQGLCLPHPSLMVSLTYELKLTLYFQAPGMCCMCSHLFKGVASWI